MTKKWNVHNKKGYLKIHVAVNVKLKEILVLDVTDEKIHDGKVLSKLVNQFLDNSWERNTINIKSDLADGGVCMTLTQISDV